MKIAVSQPMYMPWYGIFEQIRAADVFVHYDDVQLPTKSGFITRVQIKVPNGIAWLTLPIDRSGGRHVAIKEAMIAGDEWKEKHLSSLRHSYIKAPYWSQMIELVLSIYAKKTLSLAEFNQECIEICARFLGFGTKFITSSSLGCAGMKSERLLNICRSLNAKEYITGWGAKNYLDHEIFEQSGINVVYPEYSCLPYTQFHGDFNPYVSILDMIAHCGKSAPDHFNTKFINWRNVEGLL